MSLYIAHVQDDSFESINLYNCHEPDKAVISVNGIKGIKGLSDDDDLIFLLPSNLVTSYKFIQNKDISTQINLANFISEIDSKLVGQVSDNEYIFHDKNVFVIDKKTLVEINTSLSTINASIFLIPEYFANPISGLDSITQLNTKLLFHYSDGTGFGIDEYFLDQYLDIVLNNKPDYEPTIFASSKILSDRFKKSNPFEGFSFSSFLKVDLKNLPNLFKQQISFELLKNKLSFSKFQAAACLASSIVLLSAPSFLIYKNNSDALIYTSATYNIFKSINKDIKKVVAPKAQIDELVNGVPKGAAPNIKLPNLDIFYTLGSKYLTKSSINLETSVASIAIDSMPEIQFSLMQSASSQFNIYIIDKDVTSINGLVSGVIELRLTNE
ncbi:hypothetical protein N9577_00825 [Gammaproteobacteria bacterium]|nr:hypothetical protein [Gammaproteobacteria bacterium]MDB4120121.1 hypothetical protein [Gammaproteobacteria bacterium]